MEENRDKSQLYSGRMDRVDKELGWQEWWGGTLIIGPYAERTVRFI
ncbi:MAG: hypothetical protein V1915_01140 [Candidatus Bathyarchaeota archaeon]